MNPSISFIICTYNSPELVERCIKSVLKQDYCGKKEIILVDGGSDKITIDIIKKYTSNFSNIKCLNNKKRFPEGHGRGKWLGWRKCKYDYVAILDQDNELIGEDCLREMMRPFETEDIFGCACRLHTDHKDSLTNQYVSLVGTDPFFAYRSLDGMDISNFQKKNKKNYFLVNINPKNPIITGGNFFIYKKSTLNKFGGYVQDTENILRLVNNGYTKIAVLKKRATHHLAVRSFFDFLRKKKKWAKAYDASKSLGKFSYLPKTREERRSFIINLFSIALILPTLLTALKMCLKTKESAWLLHPILTFITGFIYFRYTFLRILSLKDH